MTDKVQKIREEVERLHNEYRNKKGAFYLRKALRTVLFIIDSMQEEPVSEELEKAAFDNAQKNYKEGFRGAAMQAFNEGANWKVQQMMAKAVDVSIAIPYPNGDGGYSRIVDSKEASPFGDNIKVLVIKED